MRTLITILCMASAAVSKPYVYNSQLLANSQLSPLQQALLASGNGQTLNSLAYQQSPFSYQPQSSFGGFANGNLQGLGGGLPYNTGFNGFANNGLNLNSGLGSGLNGAAYNSALGSGFNLNSGLVGNGLGYNGAGANSVGLGGLSSSGLSYNGMNINGYGETNPLLNGHGLCRNDHGVILPCGSAALNFNNLQLSLAALANRSGNGNGFSSEENVDSIAALAK